MIENPSNNPVIAHKGLHQAQLCPSKWLYSLTLDKTSFAPKSMHEKTQICSTYIYPSNLCLVEKLSRICQEHNESWDLQLPTDEYPIISSGLIVYLHENLLFFLLNNVFGS